MIDNDRHLNSRAEESKILFLLVANTCEEMMKMFSLFIIVGFVGHMRGCTRLILSMWTFSHNSHTIDCSWKINMSFSFPFYFACNLSIKMVRLPISLYCNYLFERNWPHIVCFDVPFLDFWYFFLLVSVGFAHQT